jgi:hypothetical protein
MARRRLLTKRQWWIVGLLVVGLAIIADAAIDGNRGARIGYVLAAGLATQVAAYLVMNALCRRGFLVRPAEPGQPQREGWAAIWPPTLGVVVSGIFTSTVHRGYPVAVGFGVLFGSLIAMARYVPGLAEKSSQD